MANRKGFTLVEVIVVLVLLGIVVTIATSHINSSQMMINGAADDLLSSAGVIQTSYNSFKNDKSADPTGLNDANFVPGYLAIPRPPVGFDATYGVSGFVLGYQTGQPSPNNGTYICTRANVSGAGDNTYKAILAAYARMSIHKFFYNTSCPATSNMADPAVATPVYVTIWFLRS